MDLKTPKKYYLLLSKGRLNGSNAIVDENLIPWFSSENKIDFDDFRKVENAMKGIYRIFSTDSWSIETISHIFTSDADTLNCSAKKDREIGGW